MMMDEERRAFLIEQLNILRLEYERRAQPILIELTRMEQMRTCLDMPIQMAEEMARAMGELKAPVQAEELQPPG